MDFGQLLTYKYVYIANSSQAQKPFKPFHLQGCAVVSELVDKQDREPNTLGHDSLTD